MKKIAHIQLLPLLSGVQRVSLDELSRLDKSDFQSYIICNDFGPLTVECEGYSISTIINKHLVRNISLCKDILAFVFLYRCFKKHKFDIVHTHSSKTGVLGRVAAKLAGVPTVVHTIHGFAFPAATNIFIKSIYFAMEWVGTKCSDKIICLHEQDYNFAKKYLDARDSQLKIIPNGVDFNKFTLGTPSHKYSVRSQFSIPSDSFVVGMVGRLWKQKNPMVLFESMLGLLNSNPKVHLVFVGDGELRAALEQISIVNKLTKQVHFLGWCSNTQSILKALDVFVLPSLWEGMPLAILEAQATGLPCIVSNIAGNKHLIQHEITGLLFESCDKDDLRACIIRLMNSIELRNNIGIAGFLNVKKNHCISTRVSEIVQLYRD